MALKNGWTDARRERQKILIRATKPWTRSTGPASSRGKARSSQNAVKHGFRGAAWTAFMRALARQRLDVRLYLAHRAAVRDGLNIFVLDTAVRPEKGPGNAAPTPSLYDSPRHCVKYGALPSNTGDITRFPPRRRHRQASKRARLPPRPGAIGYPACSSRPYTHSGISGGRYPSSSDRPSYSCSARRRSGLALRDSWGFPFSYAALPTHARRRRSTMAFMPLTIIKADKR